MHVRVDEAGRQIVPLDVDDLCAFEVEFAGAAHVRDSLSTDDDLAGIDDPAGGIDFGIYEGNSLHLAAPHHDLVKTVASP